MPRGGARPRTRDDDQRVANGGRRRNAGRPATKAVINTGQGIFVDLVSPEGGTPIGRGRCMIEKHGHSRIVKIPLENGEEIRILIVSD